MNDQRVWRAALGAIALGVMLRLVAVARAGPFDVVLNPGPPMDPRARQILDALAARFGAPQVLLDGAARSPATHHFAPRSRPWARIHAKLRRTSPG